MKKLIKLFGVWLNEMSWTDCDRPIWHTRRVCAWFYARSVEFDELVGINSLDSMRE